MKWLAMTRVFRLGSILKVAVPGCLALMAGAFWAGAQWQDGRHAQQALRTVERRAVEQARVVSHQQAEAAGYEQRRADRSAARPIADAELRRFTAARTDLWDCDIGDDGLRLIRSWTVPARAAARESDDPVSDAAAQPGHRPGP